MGFLQRIFLGNTVLDWLIALATVIAVCLAVWIIRNIILRRILAMVGDSERLESLRMVVEVLRKTNFLLVFVIALYFGSHVLALPAKVTNWAGPVAIIAFMLQLGIWGNAFITVWLKDFEEENLEKDAGKVTTLRAASFVARLILYSVVLLLALDNIPGVEVKTLLASLGIGGIAVALAVQNILADLFASLSISLDKPFVIGDFIIVDDCMGVVERVGLKTSRVRSLSGEQLVFSNADLLSSRIRNYKRMYERRVAFTIGVVYQTPPDKLRAIPPMIREVIESQEKTRFDRAHFKTYGDFSLIFEIVYYVAGPEYNLYMDIQQAINLAIYERFEEMSVEFAYPTQTLYMNKEQAGSDSNP